MKRVFKLIFVYVGWIGLLIFLVSSYVFNRFNDSNLYNANTIKWEDHVSLFDGAIACALTSGELLQRKEELATFIVAKANKLEELENGVLLYFEDEPKLIDQVIEFMLKEKACCPFFKFDLSILPFNRGFALQITGAKGTKEFIMDFLKEASSLN